MASRQPQIVRWLASGRQPLQAPLARLHARPHIAQAVVQAGGAALWGGGGRKPLCLSVRDFQRLSKGWAHWPSVEGLCFKPATPTATKCRSRIVSAGMRSPAKTRWIVGAKGTLPSEEDGAPARGASSAEDRYAWQCSGGSACSCVNGRYRAQCGAALASSTLAGAAAQARLLTPPASQHSAAQHSTAQLAQHSTA